jgi:hypothetical protein
VAVNLFISYWVLSSTTDGSSQVIPPFFLSGDRRSEAAATVKRVRVEETIKGRVGEAMESRRRRAGRSDEATMK